MDSKTGSSRPSVSRLVFTAEAAGSKRVARQAAPHPSGRRLPLRQDHAAGQRDRRNARSTPTARAMPSCGFAPMRRAPSIALDTLPKVFQLGFPGRRCSSAHRTDGYFSLENEFGDLDRRARRSGAGGEDPRQGIRHDLFQRVLADSLCLGADGADAAGAGRRRPARRPPITISIRPARATGPTCCSATCAIRCRALPLDDPDDYARLFLNPRDNPAI